VTTKKVGSPKQKRQPPRNPSCPRQLVGGRQAAGREGCGSLAAGNWADVRADERRAGPPLKSPPFRPIAATSEPEPVSPSACQPPTSRRRQHRLRDNSDRPETISDLRVNQETGTIVFKLTEADSTTIEQK
jgi:hypothetical protein